MPILNTLTILRQYVRVNLNCETQRNKYQIQQHIGVTVAWLRPTTSSRNRIRFDSNAFTAQTLDKTNKQDLFVPRNRICFDPHEFSLQSSRPSINKSKFFIWKNSMFCKTGHVKVLLSFANILRRGGTSRADGQDADSKSIHLNEKLLNFLYHRTIC